MKIAKNSVVSMDYKLTGPDGAVLDSSEGHGPLTYLQGSGQIIVGLETALEGKAPGDEVKAVIAPEQAYGVVNPAMVQAVPRASFQGVADIKPGMQFQAQTPQGPRVVTVKAVTDKEVTVDANHPLAGVTLTFDVKIVKVRAATAEEISHGHVHGEGGHHH